MGSEVTTFSDGILSKLFFQWVKKGSVYIIFFYLKPDEEVQLNLKHFKIFIFPSILLSLLPGEMREEKLHRFLLFGICMFPNNE